MSRRLRKRIDYLALFGDTEAPALANLSRELRDVMAAHPPPPNYRDRLRGELMAAARDKEFYRTETRNRLAVAMGVVLTVLISVVGLIAWRAMTERTSST